MRTLLVAVVALIVGSALTFLVISAGWIAPFDQSDPPEQWGQFPVPARVELLNGEDGRRVKLLEDFVYVDPHEKVWTAGRGSIVDGASIPRAFWTIAGGPFEGKYRNASIVHDEACVRKTEPSDAVHLMFYEACRCGGVPELQAKVLYAAVYHFGPSWTLKPVHEQRVTIGPDGQEKVFTVTRNVPEVKRDTQDPAAAVREKLEKYISSKNPSIEDLNALKPDSL